MEETKDIYGLIDLERTIIYLIGVACVTDIINNKIWVACNSIEGALQGARDYANNINNGIEYDFDEYVVYRLHGEKLKQYMEIIDVNEFYLNIPYFLSNDQYLEIYKTVIFNERMNDMICNRDGYRIYQYTNGENCQNMTIPKELNDEYVRTQLNKLSNLMKQNEG